jgi:hypothetical protein
MNRRRRRRDPDSWTTRVDAAGVWAVRRLAPGWQLEHRVTVAGRDRVIAETRVRAVTATPPGGLGWAALRAITLQGAVDAVIDALPLPPSVGDLGALEATIKPRARRKGEARRWQLVVVARAYVRRLGERSRQPNKDVALALGMSEDRVRDLVHEARRHDPPLLTPATGRGIPAAGALTDAGVAVIEGRLRRVGAILGILPERFVLPEPSARRDGHGAMNAVAALDTMTTALILEAERRLPGLWEMTLEEIAAASRDRSDWVRVDPAAPESPRTSDDSAGRDG